MTLTDVRLRRKAISAFMLMTRVPHEPDHFAGKLDFGCVRAVRRATSATDAPTLPFNAFREGLKISRQSAEVCDCGVLPKSAIVGCAVSASDCLAFPTIWPP